MSKTLPASVLSLAQLLEQQAPALPPCLVEPGLLPMEGILFVGGEPKVGKSLLVGNLALSLAAGSDRLGFPVPAPRRVLVCQFELPIPQFVSRLATMRRAMGDAADPAVGYSLCLHRRVSYPSKNLIRPAAAAQPPRIREICGKTP